MSHSCIRSCVSCCTQCGFAVSRLRISTTPCSGRPLSTISPAHVMTDPRCMPHAFAEGPHPLVYFSPWPVIACEKLPHMLGVLARQVVLFLLLSAHWASATATVFVERPSLFCLFIQTYIFLRVPPSLVITCLLHTCLSQQPASDRTSPNLPTATSFAIPSYQQLFEPRAYSVFHSRDF